MVYDLRTRRIPMVVRSRLLVQPDSVLLTTDLVYIIAVQHGFIVVWRLVETPAITAYHKYMTDDWPADDERLSDTDYFFNDDAYDEEQVKLKVVYGTYAVKSWQREGAVVPTSPLKFALSKNCVFVENFSSKMQYLGLK